MEYNLKDVYNAIKNNGDFKVDRSYEDFASKMNYQGYQNQIFDLLKKGGANVGSGPDEFRRHLGLKRINTNAKPSTMQGDGQGTMLMRDYKPKDTIAKASPFVNALDETRNIDYTSGKAPSIAEVGKKQRQAIKDAATAHIKKVQQAGNEPVVDTGDENVNKYLIKTQKQLSEQMDASAKSLVDSNTDKTFINNVIGQEFQKANERYSAIFNKGADLRKYTPADVADWGEAFQAKKASGELDQTKMLKDLTNVVKSNLDKWANAPSTKLDIQTEANRLGVTPEAYLESAVMPNLKQKISEEFVKADLARYMPKGDFDYVMGGMLDSTIGALVEGLKTTKSQRQLRQQTLQMTNEGENPNYKPGMWAKAGRGTVSYLTDVPLYAISGQGATAVTSRLMGNGVKMASKVANASLRGRIGLMVGQGVVHGGVTGGIYGALSGAVQNWSTGEDTSLGGYLKAIAEGSLHSAVSFAAMEGIGGAVGGLGYKIGLKGTEKGWKQKFLPTTEKIGYEVFKTGMEGIGMASGGVAANAVSGDFKGFTWEDTLESCASAVIFKLMHAKELAKREVGKDGKELGYAQSVAKKFNDFVTSGAKNGERFVFNTDDESSLRLSGNKNGMGEFEKFSDWAKASKKKNKVDTNEEDAEYVGSYYESIMNDPSVSWDTKAKFSAYVMGTAPASRPIADYHTFSYERSGEKNNPWRCYVNEYSAKGELLSKKSYKNREERDRIWDENMAKRENQILDNVYNLLVGMKLADKDMRKEFMLSKGFDESKSVDESEVNKIIVSGMEDPKSAIHQEYTDYVANHGKVKEITERVAAENGLTWNELVVAFQVKDPMKRSVAEQNACVQLRRAFEKECFPENKVHEEQSVQQGKDVARDNNLGSEKPNEAAVIDTMGELAQAEKELQAAMDGNDVFKQVYEKLKAKGLRNTEIFEALINEGLTEDDLAPLAKYIGANAKVQGMVDGTQKAIETNVTRRVDDYSYIGTLNGEKQEKGNIVYVTDSNGRKLIVTSGDMAFDANGNPKDGVGDMLMCMDEATNEPVRVSVKDVKFAGTKSKDDYANEYRQYLQTKNSEAYAKASAAQGEQGGEQQGETQKQTQKQEGRYVPKNHFKIGDEIELYDTDSRLRKIGGTTKFKITGYDKDRDMWELTDEKGSPFDYSTYVIDQSIVKQENKDAGNNSSVQEINSVNGVPFEQIKPIGKGAFGNIYDQFKGKPNEAIAFLTQQQGGEALGALHHDAVGDVDLVWGKTGTKHSDGYGLAKLVKYHPEVVANLQEVLSSMKVDKVSPNRVNLSSEKYKAAIRLDYDGKSKTWLLTAYEKEVPSDSSKTTDTATSSLSGDTALTQSEGISSKSKDKDNSSNSQEEGGVLTFADGTEVPVDEKGEPDFMKMSAEDGARFYEEYFDTDAEKQLDSDIKEMEKVLKSAKSAKVKGKTMTEKIASRKANQEAIAIAEAQLEKAREIKKAMTARKIKDTITKPEEKPVEQNTQAQTEAEKRFAEAPKVEGRRGTITLPNGEKVKGRYVAVPAAVLIPSHDPFNGYKPHEGVPLDENGHTINDRDYEHEKESQQYTENMANDYGGQAISDIPVMNPDGKIISGNGRTMAGQIAAKRGTDGKYVEARNENAEGFGMKAEDLDKLDHARIVFMPDEALPYDTATFAKFNRNEKKTQSNTQQAVANSKKLNTDEVSAIISEIEGSGSLDSFFSNSKAINDLIKTLQEKGIIGLNDVAELMEANGERLSPQGKELVKNLLLGGIFKEETIRMLGIDSGLKTKALNGIRSVMENMKLGQYSLRDEIDNAIRLLYEAKRSKMSVDDYLRQDNAFEEAARDKYSQVTQAIAQALEGNASLFRDLMAEYNNIAKIRNTGEADMFGENLSPEELVKQFLEVSKVIKENEIKLYGSKEGHQDGEGGNDAASHEEPAKEAGGAVGEESQHQVDEAEYDSAVAQLKTAKGKERERILDTMESYVKGYARKHGYDEPVVYRTKKDMTDAAKTEEEKSFIENIPEGEHYPGYYEDEKIHICLELSTGAEELKETFEHESVHADNADDPSRIEMIVAAVKETRELTRRELESVVEELSNSTHYTDLASKMETDDALRLLADEALAHLITHAYKNGVESLSEITDNSTLISIAKHSFKERENDRRRKERLAASGDKTQERSDLDAVPSKGNGGSMGSNPKEEPGTIGGGNSDNGVQTPKGTEEGVKAEAKPRQRRAGFKSERKTQADIFAEEQKKPYEGDYKEILTTSKTWQEAYDKLLNKAKEYRAKAEEWRNKTYKKNGGSVEVGGKYDDLDAKNVSIDYINERRRENTIKSLERDAEVLEKGAEQLKERCEKGVEYSADPIKGLEDAAKSHNEEKRFKELQERVHKLGRELSALVRNGENTKDVEKRLAETLKEATDKDLESTLTAIKLYGKDCPIRPIVTKLIKAEIKSRNKLRLQKASGEDKERDDQKVALTPNERIIRDLLVEGLNKKNGIATHMDVERGQRIIDMANGKDVRMSAKKRRALETVSVSRDEEHPQTVISSADGAKVLNNLDTLAESYENSSQTKEKTFVGEVAKSLGMADQGKSSQYATFETKNGEIVTIRLSNHNAKVSNFDKNGEADGISIVVSPKENKGVTNDGSAHIVEYYYDSIKLRKAEGKPLADIVRSIKQALYSGEFKDTTGLAERQEVNAGDVARLQKAFHGSSADFDYFDFDHMSEGAGSQVFGWGGYVTDSYLIARDYANLVDEDPSRRQSAIRKANGDRFIEQFPTLESFLNSEYMKMSTVPEEEKIAYYKERAKDAEPYHHIYKVSIPDDNGKNYIDWEGSLTDEQQRMVYEALYSLPKERLDKMAKDDAVFRHLLYDVILNVDKKTAIPALVKDHTLTKPTYLDGYGSADNGSVVISRLRNWLGGAKEASDFLSKAGFTGVKYPGGTIMGGAEEGYTNHVIFKPEDMKITDHVRFFRTKDGEAYGFTINGEIFIDPRVATSETPIHEYTHLWATALRTKDRKQWEHLVGELKNSTIWNEVKKAYPELKTDDAIADETFAMFSGRRGAERLRQEAERIMGSKDGELDKTKAMTALENVRKAISSFWDKVAEFFGIHRMRSAEELADMSLADLLNGSNPLKGETTMKERGEVGRSLATSGSYFSGGGLLEEGLKGVIDPKIAVEFNEKIAGVYSDNHGNHIVTADVREVDPRKLIEAVDGGEVQYFHASPVCKNYSSAKHDTEEKPLDIETATATAAFIDATKPKVVTIENVKGYRDSEAMKKITDALERNGYDWDADVYNAADFGGYTKRERLIIRAKRDGKLPPKPKALPKELQKQGWMDAVSDLIDTLPEKKGGVADWMDARLKAEGIDYRKIDRPLYVFGQGNSRTSISHAFADELLPTLRTKGGDIIVMPDGRVLKVTPRVLARVSGLGDDYKMPATDDLAHTVVGNGIPAQLTKGVIGPLLDNAIPYAERNGRAAERGDGNAESNVSGKMDLGLKLNKKENRYEDEDSEKLFLSLQHKSNNKKEYNDTVDILSERVADGRADLYGIPPKAGRETQSRISAGIEIIAASRTEKDARGAVESNEDKLRLGRLETEKAIEEWAKDKGVAYTEDDIAKNSKDGKPCAQGGEAIVYVSKDFSKVTKLVDPYMRNKESVQLCMENTRLFNELFPESAYNVIGVARDKNGNFRIVMEQPYIDGKQYDRTELSAYENGPSQAKNALMESLGLKDVDGDGLEFKNDKYYVSDLHYGNVVFDKEGIPHIIDADVKYYGKYRRENIEGKPLVVDSQNPVDSKSLFESLKTKKGKEYNDTVTELARRVSEGKARFTSLPEEFESRGVLSVAQAAGRAIASARLRDEEGRSESVQGRSSNNGGSDINLGRNGEDACIPEIEEWAKQNGCWINEDDYATKGYDTNRSGMESVVYFVGDKAVKFATYKVLHEEEGIDGYLERITMMNAIDPDAALKVIGYSRDKDGEFRIVLEQKKFAKTFTYEMDEEDCPTDRGNEQISEWMNNVAPIIERQFAERGINFSAIDYCASYKDIVEIKDLALNNLACDEKGKYHIIDGNAILIAEEEGGEWGVTDVALSDKKPSTSEGIHYHVSTADVAQAQSNVVVENHIQKVSGKLGVNVGMIGDVQDVSDPKVKADIEAGKKVTGWYDEKTGKVYLYMPNVRDTYTAEKTIWHEVVGHKGLRGLFGKDFNKFMRSLWYDLDSPINAELKAYVKERMDKDALSFYDAIEEYLADAAEKGKGERGFWNNIKNKFTDLLHEIGYRISPNVKDVKYLLWLSKNYQKHPNDPMWQMRVAALKHKLERESVPESVKYGGMFYGDDGKAHTPEEMSKEDFQEATDGRVHLRTTPSVATAIDRYQKALAAHGYMFTEAHMDNMNSLKHLLLSYLPEGTKIEDIDSNENPYMLQNTMQDAMSKTAERFEKEVMDPVTEAVAKVLSAFDGKGSTDKLRNFNLYLIKKHGLERNRVFFVRDAINGLRKSGDDATADALQKAWSAEKKRLGDELRAGNIDLKNYYAQTDEWIRKNVDDKFKADEHDYSGFHGMYEIETNDPYNDAQIIDEVMGSEKAMEGNAKGSVKDLWSKIHAATSFAIYEDYKNGISSREMYTHTSQMFDWYVPLRKFDQKMAEDVYGYVAQNGDADSFIGASIVKASGRKSLSDVNVLAQVGAMANSAILNGGNNKIKQAFARFIRNHYDTDADNRLVTECNSWLEKKGVDAQGNEIWEEVFPDIKPEYTPKKISQVVKDFEADMKAKQSQGLAKNMTSGGNIPFKFNRAKNKSEHIVTVSIAGKKHHFIINANPRAAQALNGLLENNKNLSEAMRKWTGKIGGVTRFMAQACTSFNPEFVVRNMVKDYEFSTLNLLAKEGGRYTSKFERYYLGLLPVVGWKGMSTISKENFLKDWKGSDGVGLFAKYRRGELDTNNKIERYFKEFMDNGGETGFVQMQTMKDLEKKYKLDIKSQRSWANKGGRFLKDLIFGNIESFNEVAENIARFSTYCASRDSGRGVVRSVYDAKEVTVNFNRKGSGSAISTFKHEDMSSMKNARKNLYGFSSWWCRNFVMFYNAGIQSTNMLAKNAKNNPIGTTAYIATVPFALGVFMPLINQMLIGDEDEKDRNAVKDLYLELPDYIRRNSMCFYRGKGEFLTIPLAIETRAFYGLGDLAYQMYKGQAQGDWSDHTREAVGQMAQLLPSMDYLGRKDFSENPLTESAVAFAPTVLTPTIEWYRNKDWKGSRIERRSEWSKDDPAWMRANTGTYPLLIDINKKANAMTNDVDPGNAEMLGNKWLDEITNPSAWEHYIGGFGGGAATFAGKVVNYYEQKGQGKKTENKDVPFVRSFFYTPSEGTSIQRTKTKWYNYVDDIETAKANVAKLKKRTNDPDKAIHNSDALYKYKESKTYQQLEIIERAQKEMKRIDKIRNRTTDAELVKGYNEQKDQIMMEAVDMLDKLN